jgi:hypothetical protein
MHFFGRIAIYSFLGSVLSFGVMLFYKFQPYINGLPKKDFVETPIPSLVVLFGVACVIAFLQGVLAEMQMRTYYESQSKTTYLLGQIRQPALRPPLDGRESSLQEQPSGQDRFP